MRSAYKILTRKCEGKKPHRRTRCKWEDNIKMYLKRNPFLINGLYFTA
jgi:hypothetical protein